MFEADNIRDWRGRDAIDRDNNRTCPLEAIYVDTAPMHWRSLPCGSARCGPHRPVFVPLAAATVGLGHVCAQYEKTLIKSAPAIDPVGELAAKSERRSSTTTA